MTQDTKTRRQKPSTYTQSKQGLEHGKVPPNATDLEEAVLGALMLESDALNDVVEILKPESFYRIEHQKIFEAITDLFSKSEPIDILTVSSWLKKEGSLDLVGGPYYVSQLTDRVASSANAEFHARIIAQKFIQRELIRVSGDIYHEAFEDTTDVLDLLDKAESSLFSVAEGNLRKSYDSMSVLVKKALQEVEEAATKDGGITGVPTGFTELDKMTNGWQKSDLLIIAARPAMGKTAFVLSMARNMAVDFKRPIAFFSLEMASIQLVNRLISSESGIPGEKLKKGQLDKSDWEHMHASLKQLGEAPIFIDDTAALSVFELRAKCRRLKAQHDIQMIVIDYLQLMTAGGSQKGGNREQEISTISRSLKSLAKELEVPVIALSQLSRAVETRGGTKRPMLSDLRESGAIEQDADMVMFLYRPEYYGIEVSEETNLPTEGLTELIVAKHRSGATGTVPLRFINSLAKFTNYDDPEFSIAGGPSAMPRSSEFDSPNVMTKMSRMDDLDDLEDDDDSVF
ncbi:MAG: replicative DNA helicase [Flavobacteriales bacterium]|nr:replicative DNA helicase [Flavobacteriales bacterium]